MTPAEWVATGVVVGLAVGGFLVWLGSGEPHETARDRYEQRQADRLDRWEAEQAALGKTYPYTPCGPHCQSADIAGGPVRTKTQRVGTDARARIAAAREAAGVAPGEPLLGLHLPEGPPDPPDVGGLYRYHTVHDPADPPDHGKLYRYHTHVHLAGGWRRHMHQLDTPEQAHHHPYEVLGQVTEWHEYEHAR